ncbi:hypothetical protein G9464_03565 [Halostella sp. JP-L12]|uniref:hypothetical protein n=1 Tax=Halostella TaxID=1843185 RepID=UPI000EF80236|nr:MULTISPECIES: hypothetical protein [Halostella]NHN46673.1 hypothetical protein [Halostella sp. JP-L12]
MELIRLPDLRERNADFRTVARALAVLLPLIGLAGVAGPYALGFTSLAILASYVAFPSILAPLLYLYASDVETDTSAGNQYTKRLLLTGYFLLQTVSIALLVSNDVRPYSYYAVVAGIAFVLLAQILRFSPQRDRSWPLLVQISLLHLNLVWGVTLKYNYFIGRTDIFGHVQYVRLILENGTFTSGFSGFYQAFPLWHVLGAMEHLLFGGQWAPRTTLFVISGVLYVFVPIGVFLVATRLFESHRVALLAGLLTCLDATVIHNGMYAIPRSVAAFLFVLVLLNWVRDDGRSVALFALFSLAIAAYHTVSLPFVFFILAVEYFFRRVVAPFAGDGVATRTIGTSHLLLALIVLVQAAYWLFFADYLLEHVVSIAFQESSPGQINSGVVENPFRELANYLHYSTLLVFVFVGTLTGLSSDRVSGLTKATLCSTLVLVGVSFPGPHLLVGKLAESFNVLRFAQYSFPFIAMTAAYGIVSLFRRANSPRITGETAKVVALVVFVLFSFTTVSNDFVASDNPVVERQFYTNYVSEAEEQSMRTVADVSAGNVSSDYVGTRYYNASRYAAKAQILGVNEDRDRLYFGSDRDLVLVRDAELQRRPLQVWITDSYRYDAGYLAELGYVEGDARVWSDLALTNRVYDSGTASAYHSSTVRSANRTSESGPEGATDGASRLPVRSDSSTTGTTGVT